MIERQIEPKVGYLPRSPISHRDDFCHAPLLIENDEVDFSFYNKKRFRLMKVLVGTDVGFPMKHDEHLVKLVRTITVGA
jgi:hypothetical protein